MQSQATMKREAFKRRQRRVRAKVRGTADRPRLHVFRSLRHISVQLIDDDASKTLAAASDREVALRQAQGQKTAVALKVGELIAQKAKGAGISKVVFDRTGNRYHGRVKALADGARAGGLQF
ncbi:MAG: 50S ribosomal protein L18 [Candidatus Buchananbacteria bacterium RIFCSPLOWO2_01_FULL_56_15]|uniref:Large ribosomal subunit protein uL18 n=2 Tax=Candidatus Buchananiibacteriota TaxID=1817903 RepID=A0A1G1YLD2_9BACT|nr:MAG: 50S ribosomal protein L18 [Candidatus Buchananbacteria bacterium RIFCSPHIGHO2_02_FULL_56_16]OGY54902.1 MAG: 50S ribosomal protein L18 [Candidatus Buchananbacteria bacterium RIFCSPLOWO2_01_FULL_56_15]